MPLPTSSASRLARRTSAAPRRRGPGGAAFRDADSCASLRGTAKPGAADGAGAVFAGIRGESAAVVPLGM
ncbi:MAG: hypothetical protein ACK5BN_11685 [Planctomycetota bacterium]